MLTDERLKEIEQNAPRITMHDAERGVEIIYELAAAYRLLQQQNKQMKYALESAKSYLESSSSWNAKKYEVFSKVEQSLLGGASND